MLWAGPSSKRTNFSIPSAALAFVASLALPILSIAEYDHTIRPSTLLNAYLVPTLIFDIAHARTIWLQQYNRSVGIAAVIAIAVKLALCLLENLEKQPVLFPQYRDVSPPEATAGILNRLFFLWLNKLFRKGFSNELSIDDLFILDKHLSSRYLETRVQSAWESGVYCLPRCAKEYPLTHRANSEDQKLKCSTLHFFQDVQMASSLHRLSSPLLGSFSFRATILNQ